MHVYRYQYRRKRKINKGILVFILGFAAAVLFAGNHDEVLKMLAKEVETSFYEELLELYMPGVVKSAKGEPKGSALDRLFLHFFPLGDYASEVPEYPTQVESELSRETILALEAADENYVDEKTGEVVFTGNVPESEPSDSDKKPEEVAETGTGQTDENPGEEQNVQAASGGVSEKAVTYPIEKLNDFDYLIQNFYQVDNTTTINGSQLNAEALLGKDMTLKHDASTPQILIYHTHSQEAYSDSIPGDAATSIVGVGDYLAKLLTEQYGLNVIHHKGEYDVGDRDHAYSRAGPALEQVLAENPSIDMVIDLHRDGVGENTRLVTNVNGKQTAQVMFFNGLSRTTKMGDIDYLYNPYIEDNLAISLQMKLAAAEYYPDFTRRIYLKGYRYNMHYCPKTMLIEVGAQTNTLEEAMNAMVPLADILNKVLTGKA